MAHSVHGLCWMLCTALGVAVCAVPSALDLTLMKKLITNFDKNEAISPFVMSTLMTQAWLAARGATRNEMSPVLGVSDDSFLADYQAVVAHLSSGASTVDTRVFNGIYLKTGFDVKQNFTDVLDTYYSAEVERFSDSSQGAQAINSAVAAATNNIITGLVTTADMQDALFALVSALYFKGEWLETFNRTESGQFLTASGITKQVNMMKMLTEVPYKNTSQYDAISLPYKDPNYCMLLLRPHQQSMQAVQALINSLDSLDVGNTVGELETMPVRIAMPRFKIESLYGSLESIFPALGIQRLFSSSADLGNMVDSMVHIDKVIHKVYMEVDEQGTKAAGAGVLIGKGSPLPSFILDRPFIAIVWNRLHSVNMFTAYVASP